MSDEHEKKRPTPPAAAPGPANPGRRVVTLAVVAGGCAIAASIGAPAARFLAAPLDARKGEGDWVRTVPIDRLKEGEPQRVAIVADHRDAWTIERAVELGSVWLVRKGGAVAAFSAVCPHLGCSVNKAPGSEGGFVCPCHTSSFEVDGQRRSGPAPRGLDALETRVEGGIVSVDFKRFRIGIPEKVTT